MLNVTYLVLQRRGIGKDQHKTLAVTMALMSPDLSRQTCFQVFMDSVMCCLAVYLVRDKRSFDELPLRQRQAAYDLIHV